MTYLTYWLSNPFFLGCICIAVAYVLSVRMYPVIIYLAHKRKLLDAPEARHSHKGKVPRLGGVGIFISFTLSLILLGMFLGLLRPDLIKILSLLAATIILLFMGVKDDLLGLSPRKKFGGQLIGASIVIFLTDVRISSFEGILGVGELPYIVSVLFTIFVFLLVINAFNLIDGIDGLAGSVALIASTAFGTFFLLNDQILMLLVSFILIGAVLGFLQYNLSRTNKLFMGDSGSLFTGFLLAYQGIAFLMLNDPMASAYALPNAPVLLLAILSFPLLDTLRVFVIRIVQKRSPFSPDRNHIHHGLLALGLNHKQTSLLIAFCNVLIIGLAFLLSKFNINAQLLLCVVLGSVIYLLPLLRVREKKIYFNTIKSVKDSNTIYRKAVTYGGLSSRMNRKRAHKYARSTVYANVDGPSAYSDERIVDIHKPRLQKVSKKRVSGLKE